MNSPWRSSSVLPMHSLIWHGRMSNVPGRARSGDCRFHSGDLLRSEADGGLQQSGGCLPSTSEWDAAIADFTKSLAIDPAPTRRTTTGPRLLLPNINLNVRVQITLAQSNSILTWLPAQYPDRCNANVSVVLRALAGTCSASRAVAGNTHSRGAVRRPSGAAGEFPHYAGVYRLGAAIRCGSDRKHWVASRARGRPRTGGDCAQFIRTLEEAADCLFDHSTSRERSSLAAC